MFVTQKALARRTFLRGAGVALGLPLLDAMVPALSIRARAAAAPVPRLGFFYVANGMYPGSFHPKGEGGKNFEITPILKPLEPYREYIIPFTGLSNVQATIGSGGPHTRAHATFLNGVAPKATEGADIRSGKTVDQYGADVLGKDSPLRSLEMALEPSSSGICDNGYSCVYVNTFSWQSSTAPLPMENNPRQVFERMFGDSTGDARKRQLHTEQSILDWVGEDLARLGSKLGASDRATVDEYVTMVREVEGRIQKAERNSATSFDNSAELQPVGIPDSFDEHAKMMLDLQLLAYRADITRVVSLQFSREQSARTYPWIGVTETHHGVSHHAHEPGKILMNTKINAYHMSLFAHLVEKMKATQDGDGTLLDHAMLWYGSGFGDGNIHWARNLNLVLVGGGCGQLKGGRHIVTAPDTPLMNVGVSMIQKIGGNVEKIGDSTGPLANL